jgi:hypothetical protein
MLSKQYEIILKKCSRMYEKIIVIQEVRSQNYQGSRSLRKYLQMNWTPHNPVNGFAG